MRKAQWLLALPLVLAASLGPARASSIRDNAGLFSPEAVRKAEAKLNQNERDTGINTTIETIDSLQGEPIRELTVRHAERSGTEGIYILIPKQEHKFETLVSRPFLHALTAPRRDAIRDAFVAGFKRGDFDGGLIQGVQTIAREVEQAKAENGGILRQAAPAARSGVPMRRPAARNGSFGLGSLLMIGLVIIAILFGLRLLGSLFGGGQRAGYGPGPRPMGGPGYGGPGYGGGGGGGGFMSSMFGGIGGALAGNWLYDQFSGRHHGGTVDNATYGNDAGPPAETGGSDWAGGGESTGDWGGGDAGGGGGGDWGGGGGGDWGGGGDGGGGGGDW